MLYHTRQRRADKRANGEVDRTAINLDKEDRTGQDISKDGQTDEGEKLGNKSSGNKQNRRQESMEPRFNCPQSRVELSGAPAEGAVAEAGTTVAELADPTTGQTLSLLPLLSILGIGTDCALDVDWDCADT